MTVTRGRRPGSPDTRTSILDAARSLFADKGFTGTSMRAVAIAAGVDPALVHHYFGSKDDLFVASLALPVDPREVLGPVAALGPDGAGERLLRTFLGVWDDPELQPRLLVFARGLLDPSAQSLLRDGFLRVVIEPLGTLLGIEEPQRRMPLVASQIFGIVMLRYLLAVEPLSTMSADDMVAVYAPTLQRYLTGPLP